MAKAKLLAAESTVARFENRLAALLLEAEKEGVVLEARLQPKVPLAMGSYTAVAEARSAIVHEDD